MNEQPRSIYKESLNWNTVSMDDSKKEIKKERRVRQSMEGYEKGGKDGMRGKERIIQVNMERRDWRGKNRRRGEEERKT